LLLFEKVIQKLDRERSGEERPGVGKPIHIARISKDWYELLR
jgi:hypothetical protein